MSRFSPHNPAPPFSRGGVPFVDFHAAFGDWWATNEALTSTFVGGLFDGPARQSTLFPFAVVSYQDPERGESMEDIVFEMTISSYALGDTEARRAAKTASRQILKTRSRPAFWFTHDDYPWREYAALRVGSASLSLSNFLDNGNRVWLSEQRYKFQAVATLPVETG